MLYSIFYKTDKTLSITPDAPSFQMPFLTNFRAKNEQQLVPLLDGRLHNKGSPRRFTYDISICFFLEEFTTDRIHYSY